MLSTYQALALSPTSAAKHTTALGVSESLFLQMGKLKLKEIGLRSHSSERHSELDPSPPAVQATFPGPALPKACAIELVFWNVLEKALRSSAGKTCLTLFPKLLRPRIPFFFFFSV